MTAAVAGQPRSPTLQRSSRLAAPGRAAPKARAYDYLVACLIPVYVWRIQDVIPILGKVQFPIILSLTSLVVFVLGGYAEKALPRFKSPVIKTTGFILIWAVASVPTSVYPGLSASFIITDFGKTLLMMVIIASSIRHVNDIERLALSNMGSAVIYCSFILKYSKVGSDGRLAGVLYYDANDLAMMVVCTLPLAVYFIRGGARFWQRLVALPCAGIFMVTIARSGSRGGFLGLVAVVIFLVVGFHAIPKKTRIGAVAGLGLLLVLVAGQQYWTLMGSILKPEDDYNTSAESGRMKVWARGVGYMAGHPLTGVGVNAFAVAEGTISSIAGRQLEGQGVKWSAAHNSYVQIGAELGVPGIVAFLILLRSMLMSGWQVARSKRDDTGEGPRERALAEALLATMVGYCVAGFFLSQAYSAYLYATCGLMTGLAAIALKQRRGRPPRAAAHGRLGPIPS